MKNSVMFCLLIGLLAGCAGTRHTPVPAIAPTTLSHVPSAPSTPSEGALFNPNQSGSLFEDFRARYVGDVVTILLEEDFQGAKNVKTQTDRDSEMNVGLTGILGLDFKKRMEPRYNTTIDATKAIGGATKDSFKGTGKTSRDASLTGTISSRVVEVLPDGNLRIEGTRELKINNESQYLILSGIIRPKDIGPDNTISSTRIGDARISYTGGGTLSEKQNPAWFARLLGLIAPF
ncbi:MAG: flagellar basal body L-ring protein FlgH [Deltaproteobacteria bacterium]